MFILRCLVTIYLEVKLDKSLKFLSPSFGIVQKIFLWCRAAEVTCGLRVDAGAKTSDTALLFLVYSTAEFWNLVCFRSTRTWFIYSFLNDVLRVVTGCFRPSPTYHLPVFSNTQPPEFLQLVSDTCFG